MDALFRTKKDLFSAGRLLAAIAIGLVFCIGLSMFRTFAEDCSDIREDVLRLHILANSDSGEDQALKLAVRDRILALDTTLFAEADSRADAEAAAAEQLELIRATAQDEILRQGYSYTVRAELVNMYFTTREYETFTLPAGWYDAVRITIGSGEGHNWWCVLYPPLCLPAAEAEREETLSDVFSPEKVEIIQGKRKYEYGFALLELFENIKNFFTGKQASELTNIGG